jgi:hypothetical protein
MTHKAITGKDQHTLAQEWREIQPVHPAAELFPRLSDDELVALGEDIRKNGLQHSITILIDSNRKEWLLDGVNRLNAMERVGLPFEFLRKAFGWWEVVFHVNGLEDQRAVIQQNVDPYAYVVSANIYRRHLNSERRHDLIVKLLRLYTDKSDRQIGDMAKADHKTVGTVRREVEATEIIPHLTKTKGADGKERPTRKPGTNNKSVSEPASKPPKPAQICLEEAIAATGTNKAVTAIGQQQLDNVTAHADFKPPGEPPREPEDDAWDVKLSGPALTWIKTNRDGSIFMGTGFAFRANVEIAWLGRIGEPERADRGVSSVIVAPRGRHSQKPFAQYSRIERLAGPDKVFVELFARGSGPPARWHAAGDELDAAAATTVNEDSTPIYDAQADIWRRCPRGLQGCPRAHAQRRTRMEPAMNILGIDPGIRGGLAVVSDTSSIGLLVDVIDIPAIGTGAKERVDVIAVRTWIEQHKRDFALIERAQAMPRRGASSGFKYGRATGALEAAVTLCAVPLEIIEPTAWKRFCKLPPKDKERSRQRALELFAAAHNLLARKPDHGRAEAALIELYDLINSRVIAAPPGAQPGSNRSNSH